MKNIFLKVTGLFLASLMIVLAGCEKDDLKTLDAEMVTWKKDGITSTSAELSGFVVAQGGGFTEYGVVWGTEENPTVATNKKVADNVENATYWVTVDGLEHLTTYYYRAYVLKEDGSAIYGKDDTFTTLAHTATVNISAATGITDIFAQVPVSVPYDGKADVTARGICWNTEATPTLDNTITENGEGTGDFTADMEGLLPATMYYVRAYATNKMGTAFSDEISFTTNNGVPVLKSDSVGSITKVSAKAYGVVVAEGGVAITERGFVLGQAENPTISDTKVVYSGTPADTINVDLTGLESGKRYYVRAFATNSEGTGYGEQIVFTTESDIKIWYLPGDYVEASYVGDNYANWSPESSPFVRNTDDNPTNLEGYFYVANDGSNWKFATDNTWSTNYGDNGADGTLDPGGDNMSANAGYYKVNVDMAASPMTYTAVSTSWGVIGDATPGGWGADTDLTYDVNSQTWRGVMHLTAAQIKFRANDDWAINYGKNDDKEFLGEGDNNIAIDLEADYDITLDLSNPNEYTYMANRWGVIGDATPGGWTDDTDMTWDAANGVFTVTLDMTAASFKFRANDDWGVNLGGDLGALTQDGSNFSIAEAGNYTITLNTMTNVATVTKN